MTHEFTYIDTKEKLSALVSDLKNEKVIAFDLECENNLHHYGVYISLIQISIREKNWIIDVLALRDVLEPLWKIFEDEKVQKILHDINFDLRVLGEEFDCQVQNFFDTQLAALFLGKESLGLGALLEEYYEIQKERKFQRVDWTRRPLSREQLAYAVKDSVYLIPLKEKLVEELKALGRLGWLEEELESLASQEWSLNQQTYLDVSGVRSLEPKERSIFHALFELREQIAQEVDKPVYKVIANKQLLSFAKNPPYKIESWKKLRGVHPLVKKRAEKFFHAVQEARKTEEEIVVEKRLRMKQEQRDDVKKLTEFRNKVAKKLGIRGHLIAKEDQIREVVINEKTKALRKWQRELLRI